MNRKNLAFLLGGFLYGVLVGFGIFWVLHNHSGPEPVPAQAGVPSPAGPMAPTQAGPQNAPPAGSSSAPMLQEIASLRARLDVAPDDVAARTRLANLFHDAGMWEQAIEHYEKALEVMPDNPNLITDMGICYQGMQQYEKALDLFDRAQTADPTHWQSLYNMVVVAGMNVGDFDRALAALDKLEKVNPSAPRLSELRQGLTHAREQAGAGAGP